MEPLRFIEVVGSCRCEQAVEAYRAMVVIGVTVRWRRSALLESLQVRRQVIDAFKRAGVDESSIEESGDSIDRNCWPKKRVERSLLISAPDIKVLSRAMPLVEAVCSRSHLDFSFRLILPVFARTQNLRSQALKQAVASARQQAGILAEEAGLELGGVLTMTIVEAEPTGKNHQSPCDTGLRDGDWHNESAFVEPADSLTEATPHVPTRPMHLPCHVNCRIRFAVTSAPGNLFELGNQAQKVAGQASECPMPQPGMVGVSCDGCYEKQEQIPLE